jgi:hypothetical protein
MKATQITDENIVVEMSRSDAVYVQLAIKEIYAQFGDMICDYMIPEEREALRQFFDELKKATK